MLCADLVDVQWREAGGRIRRMVANLEDISLSGACIQMDKPIPLKTRVKMSYPHGELKAFVRYCVYREIGYFIGLEFEEGNRWSQHEFKPQHMLDPRRLMEQKKERAESALVQ